MMKSMTKKQKELLLRIIAAAVLMAVLAILPLKKYPLLRFALFLIPYFTVGHDILRKALKGIRNKQVFDENFLMAAATVGAMALGEYTEGVAVMLFYQIGELFQSYAVGKSRKNISELMDIRPDYANLETEDGVEEADPDDVEIGSIILIKPGERVPIDGVIVEGTSSLDTAALTGESLPRDVAAGQEILSGSINLSGLLRVQTTKEFEESTASRILDLVENAGTRKARSEQFISKFAHWYTPAVCYSALALAILGPLVNMLIFHVPGNRALWSDWIYRALTFLVISCPCAIVVSIPLTFFGGIGGAGSKGILIKGSNFMETLANVRTVVFDKTGTLTKGNFVVTRICPAMYGGVAVETLYTSRENIENKEAAATESGKASEAADRLLEYAALAESYSSHPISRSLKEAWHKSLEKRGQGITDARNQDFSAARVGDTEEISGKGLITEVDGLRIGAGNLQLMRDLGVTITEENDHSDVEIGTIVHVCAGSEYLGHIVIADEIKPNAAEAISDLRKSGVTRTVMLTGDAEAIASRVAQKLGLDEYHAGLLPADKVTRLEQLLDEMGGGSSREVENDGSIDGNGSNADSGKKNTGSSAKNGDKGKKGTLAFVGDGINDAPVLSRADIGIAMGALGSDAAIEAADVVLMDDDPMKISRAIRLARKCIRIVNENIWFAIGVKLACLLLGALGIANMWLAIFADVGVMVLCVLNAIRALV